MSIYCSFTAVWDVWTAASCSQRGPCFPEALLSWIQLSSLTRRRSRTDIDSETLCRETQQIDQTAFFCPPCCRDAGLLAGEASRMWKQHITITTKLFFTLYILSIFTMYMMGMHIIFLLTDGFNKALCQSAVTALTVFVLWLNTSDILNFPLS